VEHKRILVVEDNKDHGRILIYRLRQTGQFEIVQAQQGDVPHPVQSNKCIKDESLRLLGKELKDSDRGVLYASYDFLASDLCTDLSYRVTPSAKLIRPLSASRSFSFKR
jgi:hypothetical protein